MPHNYSRVYYHFVWATWDRQPLLVDEIERHAYALIRSQCKKMGCEILAISGMPDHIHLLVSLPHNLCISEFMKSIKGVSSYALNEAHATPTWSFKWQRGYGVLTVSFNHIAKIGAYIEKQKEHHIAGSVSSVMEQVSED